MPAPPPSVTRAPASGHALLVRDLFAGYQQVPVVRELNLEVRPGEVVRGQIRPPVMMPTPAKRPERQHQSLRIV